MKYSLTPPYNFYVKVMPVKKLDRLKTIAEAPLRTHKRSTIVRLYEARNGYVVYALSDITEKLGMMKTEKIYIHFEENFATLEAAAEFFKEKTDWTVDEAIKGVQEKTPVKQIVRELPPLPPVDDEPETKEVSTNTDALPVLV